MVRILGGRAHDGVNSCSGNLSHGTNQQQLATESSHVDLNRPKGVDVLVWLVPKRPCRVAGVRALFVEVEGDDGLVTKVKYLRRYTRH